MSFPKNPEIGDKVTIEGKEWEYKGDDVWEVVPAEDTGAIYNNETPSVIKVGGIEEGTTFENYSFEDFMDAAFYEEQFPNLVAPSSTFTSTETGLEEVGDIITTISFNAAFDRGAIDPQYESESPYRSGLPNEYQYDHTNVIVEKQLVNQSKTDLSDSQSVNDYEVLVGSQTWRGRVAYDEGVQPKSSYGENYDSPLVAGNTNYISRTIVGVYPFFATTNTIDTMTKQGLQSHGTTITTNMIEEDGTNKQTLEVPSIWGNLSKLEQYNTLSGEWDEVDTNSFTETAINKTIHGSSIDYKKFEHNGSTIGNRQLRFTF